MIYSSGDGRVGINYISVHSCPGLVAQATWRISCLTFTCVSQEIAALARVVNLIRCA